MPGSAHRDGCEGDADGGLTGGASELENLLKDLPQIDEYNLYSETLRHMPDGSKELGWQNILKLVEKHDGGLCQAYREQIDALLVFAGLFSAVVTAFVIGSYQWLQDDPADTSVELLRNVVALLAQNSNYTALPGSSNASHISEAAVTRINVFWFLSLSLSLSAALIAILCKQWIREFERDVGQPPETALAVRHIRFQGLEYWKVGTIVTSVPLMLQLALALFLTGAVDLLWQLHSVVAGCVTVAAGATLTFYLSTTLLPLAQYAYICFKCCLPVTYTGDYCSLKAFTEPQCAFKSAQAWLLMRLAQPIIDRALKAYAIRFTLHSPPEFYPLVLRAANSWATFDLNWVKRREHLNWGSKCAYDALAWVASNLDETHLSSWIWHCVWARWHLKRDTRDSVVEAFIDIESVASAYPHISRIELPRSAAARAQAEVFRCTLRPDLPVNTAVELILRIAPHIDVDSQWTRKALEAVLEINHGLSIRLSEDNSVGLYRLAEVQTQAIISGKPGNDPEHLTAAPWSFYFIVVCLCRGSSLSSTLIPAMSALAMRWQQEKPVEEYAGAAEGIADFVLSYYWVFRGNPTHLRDIPGVAFAGGLCRLFEQLWPSQARFLFLRKPYLHAISQQLQEIELGDTRPSGSPSSMHPAGPPQIESLLALEGETSDAGDKVCASTTDLNGL